MHTRHIHPPKRQRGFTLIELMITVAIVGILAAVAYPSYVGQVRKGKRAECRAGLYQAMQQEERYFTQYNQYYGIPASGTSLVKNFSGDSLAKSACAISSSTTNLTSTVVVTATPQYTGDSVSAITLDSVGNKGCTVNGTAYTSNAPKDCWP